MEVEFDQNQNGRKFESNMTLNQVFKGNKQQGANSNELSKQMPQIDTEFKLCALINFIKKQGYPIENSFVSYYSADFQV